MTTKTHRRKAVLYGRVSSDRQEREGYSIPAQIKHGHNYAIKNNMNIVAEFIESESGKKAGRTEFNKMIKFLKKNTSVKVIIVEKTDRLYRNLRDYVTIDEADVEIHFFKTGDVISEKSTSQQKFMHGISVLMAKNYIDNLSEEIKKGLYEKAEQGYYPHKAPIGYENIKLKSGKRVIKIDPTTAPYVRRAFELYSTGRYTYVTTAEQLTFDGFRPHGHKCTDKNVERILNNPFYVGAFKFNGKLYSDGRHEPLISKDLYFIVQKLLSLKYPTKPIKHDFAYNGLIRCANCGCMITGEIKKKKYIYYHCTNSKRLDTSKPSIREEKIEQQFAEFLEQFNMPDSEFERLKEAVKEYIKQGCNYIEEKTAETKHRIDVLTRRLNKLYDDRMDGVISDDFYFEKRDEYQSELDELLFTFEKTASSATNLFDSAELLIELGKDAPRLFSMQTPKEKAELMKLLTIELLFDGQNLIITPHSAFANLLNLIKSHNLEMARVELASEMIPKRYLHS